MASIAHPSTSPARSATGSRRRVMMIAPHFEEYAFLLACGLAESDDVLLVLDVTRLQSEYHGRAVPDPPLPTLRRNGFGSLADLLRLAGDIIRFRPQVIHWQEPSGLVKSAFAAVTVALCRPFATLALTIHDPVPHDGRDKAVARRLAPFRRYTRRHVHHILVHGRSCREQYRTRCLPAPHVDDRVRLTAHGVVLVADAERPPATPFHALMFGRMESYKGLDVLCRAAETLAGIGDAVPLRIAGAGPELDVLAPRLQACPAVRVHNGFVAASDLIAMIQSAGCVLLPYTDATQSGVLAAAFANGRFVIASRVGGIADIVRDGVNGLLVEPGDHEALADALRLVASDERLRERLCEGARRTADEQMSWSKIAAELASCY